MTVSQCWTSSAPRPEFVINSKLRLLRLHSIGCFLAEVGDWIGAIIHQLPLRAINIGRITEQPALVENGANFPHHRDHGQLFSKPYWPQPQKQSDL